MMSNEKMEVPEFWEGDVYVKMTISGHFAGDVGVSPYPTSYDNDAVLLHRAFIRIDIPKGVDVRAAAIDKLTDEKEAILANAHIAAAAVQHKIDDLLQIEYTSDDEEPGL